MNASSSHTIEPFDHTLTVPAAFDAVAATFPGHVALEGVAGRLTYAQLRARSEVLAAALRRRGVGHGTVVGVYVERSFDSLVTFLAVLKSGGSYLPLSPEYPSSRLKLLLRDAGAMFVVAAELPPWASEVDSPVITLAALRAEGADGETAGQPAPVAPDDVAYVMYTSGSTGTPKGVLVTHRNIVQLVRGQGYLNFGPGETFLHLSPTAFDASTFEIWGALLAGARLVLAPPSQAVLAELPALLRERGVSAMFLTTPLFHELMDSDPDALDPVRQVLIGGEPMSLERALALARRRGGNAGGGVVANVYGPTETTTFATAFRLDQLDGGDKSVPIGIPLSHTMVYLLREDGAPVLEGEPGEIYIGGAGVAQGYLGRPAQTAERFLPDPFSGAPGARMYRSGDVGRRRPDGAIEFLGRVDSQVKIRGFRIEPVEIEEALLNHPDVREAAVVAVPVSDGVRLAAYVVPRANPGEELTPVALAAYLRGVVPAFMVPSWFVILAGLPRTVTGKLDRRELPELDEADLPRLSGDPGDETDGSLSPTEERLVAIWRQILQVETVGIDDDFFSLGGDSIRIIRVLAEAEARGLKLSLVQLFEHTTIRELAAVVQ